MYFNSDKSKKYPLNFFAKNLRDAAKTPTIQLKYCKPAQNLLEK